MKNDRATQSRINGSKSHGPATEAGHRTCVYTNMKHGMFSTRVVLDNEDPSIYQALSDSFLELWNPIDSFEYECIVAMINARWKFRRLECAEQAEMNLTMAEFRPEWKVGFIQHDGATEHAISLRHIGTHLITLIRDQEHQTRTVARNFNLLVKYRRNSGRIVPSNDQMQHAEAAAFNQSTKNEEPPEPKPAEPAPPAAATPQPAAIFTKIATVLLLFAILMQTPLKAFTKLTATNAEVSVAKRYKHR